MAGRRKKPVDLLIYEGKTHLTKADIEARREEEVKVTPEFRNVQVPEYLFQWPELVKRFDEIAEMLSKIMPESFGQPDAEQLGRYVVSEAMYELYSEKMFKAISTHDLQAHKELHMEQDRAFKQAQASASVLGLNVTSRCKLAVPSSGDDDEESEF